MSKVDFKLTIKISPVMNLRIAVIQMNPTVGDLEGNREKILRGIEEGKKKNADLIVFPELALTGYSPEDLAINPYFVKKNKQELQKIMEHVEDEIVILGFIDEWESFIYNSAAVIHRGKIVDIVHKVFLPNYGLFDEMRTFRRGDDYHILDISGFRVGIEICEDIWHDEPARIQSLNGADVIVVLNASPFYVSKQTYRERMVGARAADNLVPIVYANMVGGQDDFVMDGRSFAVNERGYVIARAKPFQEDILVIDIPRDWSLRAKAHEPRLNQYEEIPPVVIKRVEKELKNPYRFRGEISPFPAFEEEIYNVIKLALHDYVKKSGFDKVVIGISGGIDSSLVATLSADAFGPENVYGVWMPSRYNSRESYEDAKQLAENLGIHFLEIPIDSIFDEYLKNLKEAFRGYESDTTEENIQARIRGNILMALSNKYRALVITTGNKSEYATGYATLYGDMAGAYAPLKDVYKTWVYRIARWRNSVEPVIPERVFVKPPTAELKPNQTDQDVLPPYEILDEILKYAVEEDMGPEEVINLLGEKVKPYVEKTYRMLKRSEFKRKQAPLGPKVSRRAFYRERRYPNVNGFVM